MRWTTYLVSDPSTGDSAFHGRAEAVCKVVEERDEGGLRGAEGDGVGHRSDAGDGAGDGAGDCGDESGKEHGRAKMETRATTNMSSRLVADPLVVIAGALHLISISISIVRLLLHRTFPDAILSTAAAATIPLSQSRPLPLASRQCQQSPNPLAALTSAIPSNLQPHSSQALQTVPTLYAAQHLMPLRHQRRCPPPGPRLAPRPRDNLHRGYCREEHRLKPALPAPNTPSKRCLEPAPPETHLHIHLYQYTKKAGRVQPQIAPQRKCKWKCRRTGADKQD